MAEERVKVELGFVGGQIVNCLVEAASAERLEAALGQDGTGTVVLESEDGPVHVVVSQVVYYKRVVRAARVGFST